MTGAGQGTRIALFKYPTAVWLLAMIFISAPVFAEPLLSLHSAQYKVKISVLSGILTTELHASDTGYVATHAIHTTGIARMFSSGSITESSAFDATSDGLRPTKYHSDDTLTADKTKADIQFDWVANEATGTVNGAELVSQLDELVFDRISIQYKLMHDLLDGRLDSKYIMFEIDELKTLEVTNIGQKKVSTPAGKFDAIGIQHRSGNSKRVTTLWCVEELDFLPVIIEQHHKGKLKVRAVLKNYVPASS